MVNHDFISQRLERLTPQRKGEFPSSPPLSLAPARIVL